MGYLLRQIVSAQASLHDVSEMHARRHSDDVDNA
jgi:hypothetical protein